MQFSGLRHPLLLALPSRWPLRLVAAAYLLLFAATLMLVGRESTAADHGGPTVIGVTVSSSPSGGAYAIGETIEVTLTLSEAVTVDTNGGTPRLTIDMDPADWGAKWAHYSSGSGTAELRFIHEVVEPNYSTQGVAVLADTLELNGGAIRSADGVDAHLSHAGLEHDPAHRVDWRPPPQVTSVVVSSDAGGDRTYVLGDVITVRVTFDKSVVVSGAPQLKIDMDPADWGEKPAVYAGGSGTSELSFSHTVVEPNYSDQGIAVLANSLELNGGTISSEAGADAQLSHAGLGHDDQHMVDWGLVYASREPVVNRESQNYISFVEHHNAPRGVLVSKGFHGIFSDPDGDPLTYAVTIPAEYTGLVELLHIREDGSSDVLAAQSGLSLEVIQRVWFRAEAESDWKTITPTLPDRPLVTVTLTATDPGGLSASVRGDFLIAWESYPEVVRATGSGETIELTYDWEVEDTPAPSPGQFTVNVVNADGAAGTIEVRRVSVSGKVLTLELASTLAAAQSVSVDYAYDYHDDTALRRAGGGHPAPGFNGLAVVVSQLEAPEGLEVRAVPGTLNVLATWEAVDGATSYKLRWRESGGAFEAAQAVTVTAPISAITVSGYGEWEVRLQACKNAICGPEIVRTVEVSQAASLRLERAVDAEGNPRPRTITASWDSVAGATSYTLSWWRVGDDPPAADLSNGVSRQTRAASGASGPGTNAAATNQLTVPVGRTGVDFTVPDDGAYVANLQANGAGNQVIARGEEGVNQAPGQPDTTPPRLVSGEIDGDTMTFTFSEQLDESATGSRFRVIQYFSNGWASYTAHPRKVEVRGNQVVVHGLSEGGWPPWERVGLYDWVQAYYYIDDRVVPAGERLRDLAGNEVLTPHRSNGGHFPKTRSIWLRNVTEPPRLLRATVSTNWLTLTFDEALYADSVPPGSAFTVLVNGSAVGLASRDPVHVSGATVTLLLASAVSSTDMVTVSYAKPSSGRLRGVDGEAQNFTGRSVTNLVGGPPEVAGVAISSVPASGGTYTPGETIRVMVTFSQAVGVTGTPRLQIGFGPEAQDKRWADNVSGGGTPMLEFAYTVAQHDNSGRGVAVLRDGLDLNSGAIRSLTAAPVDAHLWHPGLDPDRDHRVDGVAPFLRGAILEEGRTKLSLTFNEDLVADSLPAGSAFTVKVNGSAVSLANDQPVVLAGATITLTLASAVAAGDVVTVGYTQPAQSSGGRLKDAVGYEAASFTDRAVGPDTTPPALVRTEIDGNVLTQFYSEALDPSSVPDGSAFRANLAWGVGLVNATHVAISGNAVTLSLGEHRATAGQIVNTRYYMPSDPAARKLRDPAGNVVTTTLIVSPQNLSKPTLLRANVERDRLTLTFDVTIREEMHWDPRLDTSSVPAASAFTVKVNGTEVALANASPVVVSDTTTTLSLASAVVAGDVVTVSYEKPASSPLRDRGGKEAASFTGESVANDTEAQPATGVTIVSDPGSDGTYGLGAVIRVTLAFAEAVNVTGAPRLKIKMASSYGEKWAVYEAGSGTAELTFAFTVVEPNYSSQGIAVLANSLDLNGGAIRTAADLNAGLSHPGLGHDPDHRVDWQD